MQAICYITPKAYKCPIDCECITSVIAEKRSDDCVKRVEQLRYKSEELKRDTSEMGKVDENVKIKKEIIRNKDKKKGRVNCANPCWEREQDEENERQRERKSVG